MGEKLKGPAPDPRTSKARVTSKDDAGTLVRARPRPPALASAMIDLEARETLPRPRRDRTGARALAFDDVDADAATPRASDDVARAPALPRPGAPAS
eukprot:30507-Pelagococcus_subviridis.AAC.1